jgi:hypothetical protein
MTSPSVIVSLAPNGGLQLELPGSGERTRAIPLRRTTTIDPASTIQRILDGLLASQCAIGLDGAPTRAQVEHWERHGASHDSRCAFCQHELGLLVIGTGSPSSALRDARYAKRELGGGVTVRRVATGKKTPRAKRAKAPIAKSAKTAKQLGF